ncbi:MAG: response regulator [Calditrichia bacterium]
MTNPDTGEQNHLYLPVFAPTGRDADLIGEMLQAHGIGVKKCSSWKELLAEITSETGPAIVAEEALTAVDVDDFVGFLETQPNWSDIPILVLVSRRGPGSKLDVLSEARNVTLLRRPLQVAPFLAIVRAALESRRRQFEVRNLLQNLNHLNRQLGQRADQLRKLAGELMEAEYRERKRISYLLHDDLQQLLVGISLNLHSLATAAEKPEEFAEVFAETGRLLDQTIETSRSLSYDLNPPILHQNNFREVLLWLAGQMDSRYGLKVTVEADSSVEIVKDSVKSLLFQMARELLFNVTKHAGVKEALIEVKFTDSQLMISVSDKGSGFDPSALPSEGGAEGGYGLLSIRERLSLLGGRLEITSSPGQGSCFVLNLPASSAIFREGRKAGEKVPAPEVKKPDLTAAGEKLRIIIADDHSVVRRGLVSVISLDPNIDIVAEAENGEQALEKARELYPDVVVMDVSMPVLDGIEATRRLKAEMPGIKVIGLSMFDDEDIRRRMLKNGASAYFCKSGPLEDFLTILRDLRTAESSKSVDHSPRKES